MKITNEAKDLKRTKYNQAHKRLSKFLYDYISDYGDCNFSFIGVYNNNYLLYFFNDNVFIVKGVVYFVRRCC